MNNNAIQSRLMGQAISSRMFSGYAQANNIRLAQVVSKKLTAAQEASGLHPTLDSLHTPLRPKALSFEQSAFLKNYRNNMLDLQSTAAQATARPVSLRRDGADYPYGKAVDPAALLDALK